MKIDFEFFERVICYKALSDSTYLATIVDHVKPSFFKDKTIGKIFTIITAFNEKRGKAPSLTELKTYLTTEELKQSFKQLAASFAELDKNIDKNELYENTEQFLKEKAVYTTMLDIASNIASGTVDTSIMLDKFEKACNISLITDRGLDLYSDVEKLIDDLTTVQKTIPSGWQWLDTALNGGFLEAGKALYIFAGETNIGKSIFLGNIATNISNHGKNVLLITLEMSELLYAKRLCSNVSKVPINELAVNPFAIRETMKERQEGTGRIFIKEFPPSTITPNQVKAFVKKITDTGVKIDAIVLDYVNLLHTTIGSNSYERIKIITEQIRAISYVFNCPIITATQLNRGGFGQDNPDLTTISESVGLAATADVIISIFQTEEDRQLNIIRLGMMKNRYGQRGHTQAMRIDYNTLSITQAEEEIFSSTDSTFQALEFFQS